MLTASGSHLSLGWFLAAVLASSPAAPAAALLDEWSFDSPANRALHLVENSAPGRTTPGARWDVAIPGLVTTGAGTLRLRNPGDGGPGRRTTFVNFSTEQIAGQIGLRLDLAGWNRSSTLPDSPARLELGFVQGANFLAAGLVLEFTAAGLRYGWHDADRRDHWRAPTLPGASTSPLRLRLDLDLTARLLALTRLHDELPDELIAIAALPPAIQRLTSLRLALQGDFTEGGQPDRFVDVAAISVEAGPTPTFPGLAAGPDGLPGLLRTALGLDLPEVSPTDAVPRLVPGFDATFAYRFFRARADLDYVVETSTDLLSWQEVTRNPGEPGAFANLPFGIAAPPENRRFFRLRIALPAP